MDEKAESAISADQLNVLVFKEYNGTKKFYYKAPIVSVEQDATTPNKSTVTVKLVKSTIHGVTTKFDFMFVANYDLPSSLTLEEGTTTKEEIVQAVKYEMPKVNNEYDKWNAATGASTPFPMWGEKADVEIKETGNDLNINMFRALARIDVGLAFKLNGTKMTEEAIGLEGYKIKEVKVYRTYNEGQIIPETPSTPYIPTGITRRADDKPLEFELSTSDDKYIREIYVPEADLPKDAANGNMHCVVVGLEHENKLSYYRLDFATDSDENKRVYEAILRNHRYVFNILKIKGPGFDNADTALKSTPSGAIEYDMIKWDETIHEMHVQGKYHFGLDNRELTFKAKSTAEDNKNVFIIKYQTNYPISDSDGITLEWEKDALFKAEWITKGSNGEIKLTALTTNETNEVLTDILTVKLGSFTIKTKVNQEYINFAYTIDCGTVMVHGTYRPGYVLNGTSHYIELEFTADDESIFGSPYEIYTEPIYGITFKATGTFNKLQNKVQLKGEGKLETPDDKRTEPFPVIIRSNSSSGSYCEATITPVIAKLNVLSIAHDNAAFGYNIAASRSATHKVLVNPKNFGPNDDSRVKIEGFNFIQASEWALANFSVDPNIKKWLTGEGNGGKIADIVHIAWSIAPNENSTQMLIDYMKRGGVLVALLQDNLVPIAEIMQTIYKDQSIKATTAGPAGTIYPFPGNEFNINITHGDWYAYMERLLLDPIMNGPFGDMRDKQWGEDSSSTSAVQYSKTIEDDAWDFTLTEKENQGKHTVIYSHATNLDAKQRSGNYTGLKYESDEYNMVWFGDGGFTSHELGFQGSINPNACPFAYDSNWFPIPRPKEYGDGTYKVYNAPIFCNTMAWAIERAISPELRAKKDALLKP